ncbi:MAG: general secretion pathway protein GspK [Alphaproteobacteria bacterium]|nr:general secretion pathway protein GspK [Alphaproteobacteria bacterium]
MRQRRKDDEGFVLVAALWILVLLSLIATSAFVTSRTDHFIARSVVADAQARSLAEAGITRALIALLARDQTDPWPIDGTVRHFAYAGTQIEIMIQDEFGKVDLNAASDEVLRAVLAAAGAERYSLDAIVDAIADWRDSDDDRRLHGAEKQDYRAVGLPYVPRNGPFETVVELEQVLGVSPVVAQRVLPMLTVFSRRAMVDPAVAPDELWRLLPEVAAGIAGGSSATQSPTGARPARTRTGNEGTTSSLVDIVGRAFAISTKVATANGTAYRSAVIRFTGDQKQPFWVHEWR